MDSQTEEQLAKDAHLIAAPFRFVEHLTRELLGIIILFVAGPFILIHTIIYHPDQVSALLQIGGILFLATLPWSFIALCIAIVLGKVLVQWFYEEFIDGIIHPPCWHDMITITYNYDIDNQVWFPTDTDRTVEKQDGTIVKLYELQLNDKTSKGCVTKITKGRSKW